MTVAATRKPKSQSKSENVVDRLIDQVETAEAKRQADQQKEDVERAKWLVGVLRRYDNPQDGDVAALQAYMRDCNVTIGAIKGAMELVAKADMFYERHQKENRAVKAEQKAREELKETEQRFKQEIAEKVTAWRSAQAESSQCSYAAGELLVLARKRPDLFDKTANPPRLL